MMRLNRKAKKLRRLITEVVTLVLKKAVVIYQNQEI